MAAPTHGANGTATDGAPGGNLTVVPPSHSAGALLLLWVTSQAEVVATPSGGWEFVARATNLPVGAVSIYCFSLVAPNSSVPNVTVTDPGNFAYAFIERIDDCDPTDPIAAVATAVSTNGNTTGYIAGIRMPEADCLYVGAMAWSLDSAGPIAGTEVNADLTSLTERFDGGTTDGGGGGIVVYTGNKAAGGFVDVTTNTITSTTVASIALAIRPAASAPATPYTLDIEVLDDGGTSPAADGTPFVVWDLTLGVRETTGVVAGGSGLASVPVRFNNAGRYLVTVDDGTHRSCSVASTAT